MKILYGVCGEGFGHSSRAKKVIPFLQAQGHEVLVVTYGQAYGVLKQFNVLKVQGIKLFFVDGKMSLNETFSGNLEGIIKNLKDWNKIWSKAREFSPDVCISDMEPIVPIISHYLKTPLISFDNQHRLTNLKLDVPKKYQKDYLIARMAVNTVVSRAEAFIVLSFTRVKKKEKTYVVDPILREEIISLKPRRKDYLLVYMTKPDKEILSLLKEIDEKFVVYGYDVDNIEENLRFKKTGPGFIRDLKDAKAIIASAGFTLMSEALYLKKPYFAIPLQGQFEQTLNALFLKKSKLGDFSDKPTKKELEKFLKNLDKYSLKLEKYRMNPDDAVETLSSVLEKISGNTC
jgi:uncharacterized protein (TIGR00661 family)